MTSAKIKHLIGSFIVSLTVLAVSGGLGSLLVDLTIGGIHTSNDIGRVATDGAFATLIFAYPAPFILAAISTLYTFSQLSEADSDD